jgi:hypothetical protein
MRYGMSYIHETVWKGVPKFLRRVDTALKNIGINQRLPYNVPLIKFCSWMGGDRDGTFLLYFFFNKVAGALCLSIKRNSPTYFGCNRCSDKLVHQSVLSCGLEF